MSPNNDLPPELREIALSLSRRGFMRGVGATGAVVAGAGLLAACGTSGKANSGGTAASAAPSTPDLSDTDKVINFSNWQLYIDISDTNKNDHPTFDEFTKKTGVKVNYAEDILDNESYYAKLAPQLKAGQDAGHDLVVLTDFMASRMIRQGLVQKIDKSNTPNFPKNLVAALASPEFDKTRDFTAPWQSGLTGMAYNKKLTGKVNSVSELLTRADLKGKVTCLTEMRDTIGLIMLDQGKDPAKFTDADYDAAIAMLQKAVDSKQIRQFTGNEYSQGLAKGDISACLAWSGDVIQLQADNPDIEFVAPEAGLMLWSDNMQIPIKAQHKKNAELLMNFYYDPAMAAQLAAYVNYICPVEGAKEEMLKIDKTLAANELIFPSAATLAKTHIFMGLDTVQEAKYKEQFNTVTGA